MKPKFNDPERKWRYVLMQFTERGSGNRITYRPDYDPDSYGSNTVAIFKVKLKDNRTWLQKIFDFGRCRKQIEKHLIISQLHTC